MALRSGSGILRSDAETPVRHGSFQSPRRARSSASVLACARRPPSSTRSASAKRAMPGPAVFVISGHGWGHGVGMTQWGAYGYAQQGTTTTRSSRTTTAAPRSARRTVTQACASARRRTLEADRLRRRRRHGPRRHRPALAPRRGQADVRPEPEDQGHRRRSNRSALPAPLTFLPGATPLRFGATATAASSVSVDATASCARQRRSGSRQYLYGVVPSEMPNDWLARGAQGAGRRGAIVRARVRKTGAWFDLYPDTRSQVYLGSPHEAPSTTAAVQATAGQVVLYGGQDGDDVLLLDLGRPHRVCSRGVASSPQPPTSSRSTIRTTRCRRTIAGGRSSSRPSGSRRMLGVRGALSDVTLELGPSGRVETITGVGAQGAATMKGWDFRRALGLDSTWFRVGVLSLGSPQAPVTYGTRVMSTGSLAACRPSGSTGVSRARPGRSCARSHPARAGRS